MSKGQSISFIEGKVMTEKDKNSTHQPFLCLPPSSLRGASINYVGKILPIFDPLPLHNQVYYINLCSSISIWLTPLPLACLRSLWMPHTINTINYLKTTLSPPEKYPISPLS